MHECSVTESILNAVAEKAREAGASRVTSINLVIGEDTGFMGDSIQFYFDRLSKGSIAEGAALHLEFVKPKLRCPGCGGLFERKRFTFTCPSCGAEGVPTKIGRECYIETMEIEEA